MQVDDKLLEKYYKGHCTKAEREAVEQWLASDTFDDVPLQLSNKAEKEVHKQQIWQQVSQVFNVPTVLYKKIISYAAACIILLFIGYKSMLIFNNTVVNPSMAINNDCVESSKQIPIRGTNFTLINNDCIEETIIYWKNTKSEVVFSGKVEIRHTNTRAVAYRKLTAKNAGIKPEKGLRYFAFNVKDKNGTEKTHLVDEAGFKAHFPRLQFFLS
ncbi:hypothetical protein [Flavivirga algicola]|uniref:Anti-sigma factor n=1 Tax=Flavivirga algicola TaxID=2729136 RepID=A0ABX1RW14_9FLAO|nr:hypothetical protein [Flavivirga algicola]NMH87233.1 hypothetical protein [Flavivirga algicola]